MWRMISSCCFVGMLFAYYFLARVRSDACSRSIHLRGLHAGHWHVPPGTLRRLYRRLFGNLREQKFAPAART